MELFLIFLFACLIIGMSAPERTAQRQLWIVGGLVTVVTVLYYSFAGLIY